MKPPRFLLPSHWKMTPKLLVAFFLTATLPVLATSLFSLNYYYGASFENAQRTLAKELETARHFMAEWTKGLGADTRLAARENVVAINLSLGLVEPVLDYLERLRVERNLTFVRLLDAQGAPVGRGTNEGQVGSEPTASQLAQAASQGGLTYFSDRGDRLILESIAPITDDYGGTNYYLVTGTDPSSREPGSILSVIQQTVSGPVTLGNSAGLLGSAPGSPNWDAQAPWPTTRIEPRTLVPVKAQGTTYLFGFTALGDVRSASVGWIGVSFSLEGFRRVTNAAAGGLILISLFFVLLSIVTAVAFSRGLTRPLLMMARQANAWTEGLGGRRLDVTTRDETGILGRAFNEALDRLDVTLESLRKTQNYLKNIFNSLTSVLVSVNERGVIQEWNVAAERFSGLKAPEALGRQIGDLSAVFEGLEPSLYLAFVTREPQFLHKYLGHGRNQQTFDLCLYPLVWNGVSGVVIRMDDITESLRKDKQLRQAQKMETIGTLTEGIAHNFNNLLTGISGTVSLVGLDLRDSSPLSRDRLSMQMAMIEESTKKAAEIVRRLMALGRAEGSEFVPVNLAALLREVAKTSKMVLENTVEVSLDLSVSGPALVMGDRSQLDQCLLNLIINAAHAMTIMKPRSERHGGTIQLKLGVLASVNEFLMSHPGALKSDYWLLQVQDTGVGIPHENLAKIFDPFFTTKDHVRGSGLGLSMVYTSIHQHNGFIDVYSEVRRGTTFSLYLPVYSGASPEPTNPRSVAPTRRGTGLILVVDDEIIVQTTAQMMLQACGYEVVTADNGFEALSVYEKRGREIRAVILDSSMPKLSGPETLIALRKLNPAVKVILSSGLFDGSRIEEVPEGPALQILAKPYSVAELSKSLDELLGGKKP